MATVLSSSALSDLYLKLWISEMNQHNGQLDMHSLIRGSHLPLQTSVIP